MTNENITHKVENNILKLNVDDPHLQFQFLIDPVQDLDAYYDKNPATGELTPKKDQPVGPIKYIDSVNVAVKTKEGYKHICSYTKPEIQKVEVYCNNQLVKTYTKLINAPEFHQTIPNDNHKDIELIETTNESVVEDTDERKFILGSDKAQKFLLDGGSVAVNGAGGDDEYHLNSSQVSTKVIDDPTGNNVGFIAIDSGQRVQSDLTLMLFAALKSRNTFFVNPENPIAVVTAGSLQKLTVHHETGTTQTFVKTGFFSLLFEQITAVKNSTTLADTPGCTKLVNLNERKSLINQKGTINKPFTFKFEITYSEANPEVNIVSSPNSSSIIELFVDTDETPVIMHARNDIFGFTKLGKDGHIIKFEHAKKMIYLKNGEISRIKLTRTANSMKSVTWDYNSDKKTFELYR